MVYKYEWVANGINYLMTFIFYPALVVLFSSKPLAKLFDHKCIGTLGKITYDTYIWHNPGFLLLYIIPTVAKQSWSLLTMKAMLLYTVFSFVAGAVSYYTLEQPINRWIDKIGLAADFHKSAE